MADVSALHRNLLLLLAKGKSFGRSMSLFETTGKRISCFEGGLGKQAVNLERRVTAQLEKHRQDSSVEIRDRRSVYRISKQQVAHSKDVRDLMKIEDQGVRINELERLLIEVGQIQPRRKALTAALTELEGKLEGDAWGEDSLEKLSATHKGQNDVGEGRGVGSG